MKSIPRFVLNYTVYAFLIMAGAILIGKMAIDNTLSDTAQVINAVEKPEIIIDPGHGGEDGGASVGDVLEKNLNLDISITLHDLYTLFGIPSELTRSEDKLLYDHYNELTDYKGKKKTYDLRSRLRMAEESEAKLYVGVHMNKFPAEKYKGLQVYYSPNTEESERAASLVQAYAKKHLDPDNKREIKKATQAIYILKRISLPAVLVECGFLSNPEERELLTTPSYKQKLASVIFSSTCEYLVSCKTE